MISITKAMYHYLLLIDDCFRTAELDVLNVHSKGRNRNISFGWAANFRWYAFSVILKKIDDCFRTAELDVLNVHSKGRNRNISFGRACNFRWYASLVSKEN